MLAVANESNIISKSRIETLATLREPVWIWDPGAGGLLWANAAAVRAWGVLDVDTLRRAPIDRAMPALTALRHGELEGGTLRSLTFWTPRGALTRDCRCEHVTYDGHPDAVLVEALTLPREIGDRPQHKAVKSMTADHEPDSQARRTKGNGAMPSAASEQPATMHQGPPSETDQQAMVEIARQIAARAASDATPFSRPLLAQPEVGQQPTEMSPANDVAEPVLPADNQGANAPAATNGLWSDARPPNEDGQDAVGEETRSASRLMPETTALADALPLGIAICSNGRLIHANRQWLDVFGYDHVKDVIEPNPLTALLPDANARLLTPATLRPGKVAVRRTRAMLRSGRVQTVTIGALLLANTGDDEARTLLMLDEPPRRSVASHNDLATDELELVAKVSHEVRTPLTAIIGFAEIMKERQFGPIANTRYEGYVDDILTSARHALSLIVELLEQSRDDAGHLAPERTEIDIVECVAEALRTMRPLALKEEVHLIDGLPKRMPSVLADRRRLVQILLNLLTNAIKHSRPDGTVTVTTELNALRGLLIRITDTGVGMTSEQIEHVLERYRGSPIGRNDNGGTGIGLPLSKALAEANGAELHVSSAPDMGTTVEIAFPLELRPS